MLPAALVAAPNGCGRLRRHSRVAHDSRHPPTPACRERLWWPPAECKCFCRQRMFSAAVAADGYLPTIECRNCHTHRSLPTTFYCWHPQTPSISPIKTTPFNLDSFVFVTILRFLLLAAAILFYLYRFEFYPERATYRKSQLLVVLRGSIQTYLN